MYVTSFCSQDVKRLWVDSQERLALWIILFPKHGQENWWYYGLSSCWTELFFESWCMSRHLHLGHWFPCSSTETEGVCPVANVAPVLTFCYAVLHTSFLNLSKAHAFQSIGNQALSSGASCEISEMKINSISISWRLMWHLQHKQSLLLGRKIKSCAT